MNESNAESGTSISELLVNFEKAAYALEQRYGVCIQLARIIGKRWSYLAGSILDRTPFQPSRRIKLNENCGLVIYCGEEFKLQDEELRRLFCRFFNEVREDE